MKERITLALLVFLTAACGDPVAPPTAGADPPSPPILATNFESEGEDPLRDTLVKHKHCSLDAGELQVNYLGYERGSERVVRPIPLPQMGTEMTLCYDVRFPKGFDFAKGGKLHGLGPASPITGGDEMKPDGWSARVTFREGGGIAIYLYRQDKRGRFGATQNAKSFRFKPGRSHAVTLQVKLNDPAEANGHAHLYVDGELVVRSDGVKFRGVGGLPSEIQKLLFSTFHGGQSESYAPRDASGEFSIEHAHFDNFAVFLGATVRRSPLTAAP